MNTAEQNYLLLQEIEASRMFLLLACQQNPKLLERADERIRQMFGVPQSSTNLQSLPSGAVGKQRGISLIELIMFMVIISIAVSGVLLVMNNVAAHSADTLVRKQALAVAESLLEEIELQSLTAGCVGTLGLNAVRTGATLVCDYNGYSTDAGIREYSTNLLIPNLAAYNISPPVTVVTTAGLGGIPAASAVFITVSVTGPGGVIEISGYRAGN